MRPEPVDALRGLGLDVVAELVEHGCGFAQGYLLGRPAVPEAVELVRVPAQRVAV